MNTRDQVRKIMADSLGHQVSKIEDAALLTDLVNSSFLLVEMVIELQEEFDIRFQQSDLADVQTVGELIDLVEPRIPEIGAA